MGEITFVRGTSPILAQYTGQYFEGPYIASRHVYLQFRQLVPTGDRPELLRLFGTCVMLVTSPVQASS
jgi:hypothetical protein